jgi:hypothetical protein
MRALEAGGGVSNTGGRSGHVQGSGPEMRRDSRAGGRRYLRTQYLEKNVDKSNKAEFTFNTCGPAGSGYPRLHTPPNTPPNIVNDEQHQQHKQGCNPVSR